MRDICFLDMDGVLVDFNGGAMRHHGRYVPPKEQTWDLVSLLGFGERKNEFWMSLGYNFWSELEWTKEGPELVKLAESIYGADNVFIISSPCETEGCMEGKRAWIKKHLPNYRRRLYLGNDKSGIAAPRKLLIDDHTTNVENWRVSYGKAILVPRPWNNRREETTDIGCFCLEKLAAEMLEAKK